MSVVVLVALVAIAGVALALAIVVVVLAALRRTSRDRAAELRATFPDAELGPELGQYRGGTGAYSRVRNTSWIVLTPTTVVVRPLLGSAVAVPTTEITGTRIEKSFNGQRNGRPVLVLETVRGEVGVTVASPEQWQAALVR